MIQNNTVPNSEQSGFKIFGIKPEILQVLEKNDWNTPTPIQSKVIPTGIEGKDIIGIAQTGTGKTLAFGIPVVQRVALEKRRALIVLPTRELAIQVNETLKKLCLPFKIHTSVLIGGESMYFQVRDLKYRPEILVVTPGRLIDHMRQGTVKLDDFSILVLDEADHMFDIGFAPQIREILKGMPKERQTMLFSATMPEAIATLATTHMALPLRIEVAPSGTTIEKIEQEIIIVNKSAKLTLLVKLLSESQGSVLVFTRLKHSAKDVAKSLRDTGFTAAEIHSNRSLNQRREALEGFKRSKYRVLVATDIAARGIDVKNIAIVVNFDLPEQSEDYVHRIGRTGRAGKSGKAISFAMPDQHRDIIEIEKLIKRAIPIKGHEGARIIPNSSYRPARRGGYRGSSRNTNKNRGYAGGKFGGGQGRRFGGGNNFRRA